MNKISSNISDYNSRKSEVTSPSQKVSEETKIFQKQIEQQNENKSDDINREISHWNIQESENSSTEIQSDLIFEHVSSLSLYKKEQIKEDNEIILIEDSIPNIEESLPKNFTFPSLKTLEPINSIIDEITISAELNPSFNLPSYLSSHLDLDSDIILKTGIEGYNLITTVHYYRIKANSPFRSIAYLLFCMRHWLENGLEMPENIVILFDQAFSIFRKNQQEFENLENTNAFKPIETVFKLICIIEENNQRFYYLKTKDKKYLESLSNSIQKHVKLNNMVLNNLLDSRKNLNDKAEIVGIIDSFFEPKCREDFIKNSSDNIEISTLYLSQYEQKFQIKTVFNHLNKIYLNFIHGNSSLVIDELENLTSALKKYVQIASSGKLDYDKMRRNLNGYIKEILPQKEYAAISPFIGLAHIKVGSLPFLLIALLKSSYEQCEEKEFLRLENCLIEYYKSQMSNLVVPIETLKLKDQNNICGLFINEIFLKTMDEEKARRKKLSTSDKEKFVNKLSQMNMHFSQQFSQPILTFIPQSDPLLDDLLFIQFEDEKVIQYVKNEIEIQDFSFIRNELQLEAVINRTNINSFELLEQQLKKMTQTYHYFENHASLRTQLNQTFQKELFANKIEIQLSENNLDLILGLSNTPKIRRKAVIQHLQNLQIQGLEVKPNSTHIHIPFNLSDIEQQATTLIHGILNVCQKLKIVNKKPQKNEVRNHSQQKFESQPLQSKLPRNPDSIQKNKNSSHTILTTSAKPQPVEPLSNQELTIEWPLSKTKFSLSVEGSIKLLHHPVLENTFFGKMKKGLFKDEMKVSEKAFQEVLSKGEYTNYGSGIKFVTAGERKKHDLPKEYNLKLKVKGVGKNGNSRVFGRKVETVNVDGKRKYLYHFDRLIQKAH